MSETIRIVVNGIEQPAVTVVVSLGSRGLQGATGPQGPAGAAGATGATGATGPQGLKGDKGDTGSQGLKGDKGDTGSQGLKGDKGDTGSQGPQGSMGTMGAAIGGYTLGTADMGVVVNPSAGDAIVQLPSAQGLYRQFIVAVDPSFNYGSSGAAVSILGSNGEPVHGETGGISLNAGGDYATVIMSGSSVTGAVVASRSPERGTVRLWNRAYSEIPRGWRAYTEGYGVYPKMAASGDPWGTIVGADTHTHYDHALTPALDHAARAGTQFGAPGEGAQDAYHPYGDLQYFMHNAAENKPRALLIPVIVKL